MPVRLYSMACSALMLVASPGTAFAQAETVHNCLESRAGREALATFVARTIQDEPLAKDEQERLVMNGLDCAETYGIPVDQRTDYVQYGIAVASLDLLAAELTGLGLAPAIIDKAIGLASDSAGVVPEESVSDDQIEMMTEGFAAEGVDLEAVTESMWVTVGVYVAMTSRYWRLRKALGL